MGKHKRGRARAPLTEGMRVVTNGTLEGADPFQPLVVVEVHKDRTVDVVVEGGGRKWERVEPDELTVIST